MCENESTYTRESVAYLCISGVAFSDAVFGNDHDAPEFGHFKGVRQASNTAAEDLRDHSTRQCSEHRCLHTQAAARSGAKTKGRVPAATPGLWRPRTRKSECTTDASPMLELAEAGPARARTARRGRDRAIGINPQAFWAGRRRWPRADKGDTHVANADRVAAILLRSLSTAMN